MKVGIGPVNLKMKKLHFCSPPCALTVPAAPVTKKPKLVVAIVVDQFRYDYLNRFRSEYTGGFARLLIEGRCSQMLTTSTSRQ